MLVLKPFTEDHGWSMLFSQFPCAYGFSTRRLAYMLDSLVRVSRRVKWLPSASVSSVTSDLGQAGSRNYTAHLTHADQHNALIGKALTLHKTKAHTGNHFLPPQQFQALLTLFSKCFSSFPHGTCSLSVSRQYLALEGIYLQIRAAFPNYPTLRKRLVE